MSNVLIIKHGSLGDLVQALGAIKDIKSSFKDDKVLLLTSKPFTELMSQCPFIDGILTDKRLPRWNVFYLLKLKKLLKRYNFSHIFDLQNSSRTKFYKKFILEKNIKWSSSETALEIGEKKSDFDKSPVLERMQVQLKKSGINTANTMNVDLSWSLIDVSRLIKQYTNGEYLLLFPFCSKKHIKKIWPYYKELINKIKEFYKDKYSILVAPGPGEVEMAKKLGAKLVLDDNKPVNLNTLISLIDKAKFIISNDTGPAHISHHMNKKGLVLFGSHTSPKKVSIGNLELKSIQVEDLKKLKPDAVMESISKSLN